MSYSYQYLFKQAASSGLLHRSQVRNYTSELESLLKRGLVKKMHVKGKVFYALTEQSLPLLDEYRHMLLHSAKLNSQLYPRSAFYKALLNDPRFLDESHPEAQEFLFLGDWQLHRRPTLTQLELQKQRRLDFFLNDSGKARHAGKVS
jgi:hypothetical protein